MTTEKTTEKTKPAAGPLPVGTVVKVPHGDDRHSYALVVGYTDPVEERDEPRPEGGTVKVAAAPHGYPLLLDLPGQPREHQADHEQV